MKRFFNFLMVAAIIMGMSGATFAKDFKGVINYKITYPGMEVDASMAAMMPKMAILTIRGDMSKFEISMGQMGSQVVIINGESQIITTCMDMMGQKYYYTESQEDIINDADKDKVSIDIKDETKEIAGYECTKAVITVKESGEDMLFTIYFTEEITSSSLNMDNPYFKDIPGAMLEFEVNTGGGTMKMSATSVNKKNVSESEFDVPEGYVKKSAAEVKQMFGGGM